MITSRRSFLTGLGAALITAPAVVRASSLMPVRGLVMPVEQPLSIVMAPDMYAALCDATRRAFLPRLYDRITALDFVAGADGRIALDTPTAL